MNFEMKLGKRKMLIKAFFDEGAILFGSFVLASGKESDYYINVKKLTTNPKALKLIAELMAERIEVGGIEFDRVAGPELGAVPIATALALETGKPLVIVRKKPKGHGTGSQIEGEVKPGERVLLVEDVTTTGGDYGVVLHNVSNAVILNSQFMNASGDGLMLLNSSNIYIAYSDITNNGNYGVEVGDKSSGG
jgi:orotate phosphoribosyltransferase